MPKVLKVTVGQRIAAQLALLAQAEEVSEPELVRRALWYYLERTIVPGWPANGSPVAHGWPTDADAVETLQEQKGTCKARRRATGGPSVGQGREDEGAAAPSSSPPSVPPASPPDTPPSFSPPADARAVDSVLVFPCVGERREWHLTKAQVRLWEEVYGDLDVLAEAKRAREWLLANSPKTFNGMRRFLVRWFKRSIDSGRYPRRLRSIGTAHGSLRATYGFEDWSEWETALRQHLEGADLAEELTRLRELRREWEVSHGR